MGRYAGRIEVVVRGVCVKDGRLLFCRSRGAANTYLPGGHVEFEESAAEALHRELGEELGLRARVGHFLGAVEHTFMQKGARHCELNLVFAFDAPGLSTAVAPVSLEKKIRFGWTPLASLSRSPLEPAPLRRALSRWLRSSGEPRRWLSTY